MKNRINNILKHKTLSRLPQESGFYSGDCPGAAAITILSSLFSSLRGTLGRRTEVGSRKTEVGSQLVPHFLFLISYFLFPNFLNADRSKDAVRFAYDATPLDLSACTAPDNVGQIKKGKENKEHRISLPGLLTGNVKSGKNIPVRCTSGYHTLSGATNINGALHLGFQNADTAISGIAAAPRNTLSGNRRVCRTAISETAAAPRNICRTNGHPSEKKVQRTKKLKENNKYRITNNEYRIRKAENGIRNLTGNDIPTKFQKSAPSPPLWGGREGLSPHLPRGGFYSGDCSGAAAITISSILFSSSRLSPNFAGAMRYALSGLKPLSAYLPTGLPVANQQALHRSSFVPLVKGDKSRFIGTGGHEDKIPENLEVSTTSPKIRMKGFLKERRYAVT